MGFFAVFVQHMRMHQGGSKNERWDVDGATLLLHEAASHART